MAVKFQSNSRTADCSEVCESTRLPFFTTILGAFQNSSVFSAPVRLHTISGRPVSRVRASHSPFGPWIPGPQEDGERRICAPWDFKVPAIPGVNASAQTNRPTFIPSHWSGTIPSPGLDHERESLLTLILRCFPAISPSELMTKTEL